MSVLELLYFHSYSHCLSPSVLNVGMKTHPCLSDTFLSLLKLKSTLQTNIRLLLFEEVFVTTPLMKRHSMIKQLSTKLSEKSLWYLWTSSEQTNPLFQPNCRVHLVSQNTPKFFVMWFWKIRTNVFCGKDCYEKSHKDAKWVPEIGCRSTYINKEADVF